MILLLSINAMLVGESKPLIRVSTFRFGSLVMEGAAKAVGELWIKYMITGIMIANGTVMPIFIALLFNDPA
jgi:hypothetical protein